MDESVGILSTLVLLQGKKCSSNFLCLQGENAAKIKFASSRWFGCLASLPWVELLMLLLDLWDHGAHPLVGWAPRTCKMMVQLGWAPK